MDLGSANGTYVNNNRIESQKYVQLLEKVKFVVARIRLSPSCLLWRLGGGGLGFSIFRSSKWYEKSQIYLVQKFFFYLFECLLNK